MPRNACVIQITPVRLTTTSANDASVVRKIYLSIDPIVTARPRTKPRERDGSRPTPVWSLRHPSHRPLSHYHPFDPSTKWPPHGTLGIWLIFRGMWRPRHARLGSMAAGGPYYIEPGWFGPYVSVAGSPEQARRTPQNPDFWRNCPCPTPSRSALSRF